MYLYDRTPTNTLTSDPNLGSYSSLHGLGEPDLQASLAKIKAALDLNPTQGYVKGSVARRKLEEAFESVPQCPAFDVADRLTSGQSALNKLFRHRLAAATQRAMLRILIRKAQACRDKLAAELRRREEEQRQLQRQLDAVNRAICDNLKTRQRVVQAVCNQGQNSDQCKKLRAEDAEAREGLTCP